jgi:transcriptional regulator with XRE-family HTH domain
MNLREIRENRGLTQQGIAEICAISLSSYQKYENEINKLENAKFSIVLKIAQALNVLPQKLLSDDYEYGDAKKRNLESELTELLFCESEYYTQIKDTKLDKIDTKISIARTIVNHLVGECSLGEIEKKEASYYFDTSKVVCTIPVIEYDLEIIIEISTAQIKTTAKYIGENETWKDNQQTLFIYGGLLAKKFMLSPDYYMEQFTDFLLIKLVEYLKYINKDVNYENSLRFINISTFDFNKS